MKKPAALFGASGLYQLLRSLFNLAWTLFAVPFAGQCLFGAPLLPWFQIKRVPFDLLYNVLLLDFAFEAA